VRRDYLPFNALYDAADPETYVLHREIELRLMDEDGEPLERGRVIGKPM
jgi:hypothetical protein